MNKNLVSVDYGASGGRTILGKFDGEKITLDEINRFLNEPVKLNDTLHWDFLRLFHEMKQGFQKISKMGIKEIDGVGIDTWGVDFGLLDSKGSLMANPVHYRDSRTYKVFGEIKKELGTDYIYKTTGIQLVDFNTLYQLCALKRADDIVYKNAKDLLFMPDLFNYYLTGVKNTEFSILSTSQLYDPIKGDYAWEMIDRLGLNKEVFNEIISSGTSLGSMKKDILDETGLKSANVYAITGHDTACAVVSVPSVDISNTLYLSSGTWSLMGIESTKPYINDISYKYNLTNEGGYDNTFRVLANIIGLWIYQECRRDWIKREGSVSFDDLEDEAEKCKGFVSFIDPDDHVFFEPGNMPDKIQEFCRKTGQIVPETKGEIVLTILQSLAMKYKQVAKQMDEVRNKEHKTINIIGGGSRNVILSQFTANATKKTVLTGPIEATSVGNLLVQLLAIGELKNIGEARELSKRSFEIKVFEPKQTNKWDDAYDRFLKITR